MNKRYVTAQEFLDLPRAVQGAFMNWWKPQIGDLHSYSDYDFVIKTIESKHDIAEEMIPLLNMQQLIEFICDVLKCRIEAIHLSRFRSYYCVDIECVDIERANGTCWCLTASKKNLFDALFEIACKVAEYEKHYDFE